MPAADAHPALAPAVAAHQAGRLAEAIAGYRAVLDDHPGDPGAQSLLGLALVHQGQPGEGLGLLERAAAAAPLQAGYRLNLAEGLVAFGALDRAEAELRQVLTVQPDNAQAWTRLGDVQARLGRDAEARESWLKAVEADPAAAGPASRLARLLVGQGQPREALALLEAPTQRDPRHRGLLLARAEALTALRDWAGLEPVARAWTQWHPADPEGHRQLARSAFERGLHQLAVQALGRVLELVRPTAGDWCTYAAVCLHALEFDEAARGLAAAEALDPAHAATLAQRALLELYHGRFEAAAAAARRCLEREPGNVTAYAVLSRVQRGALEARDLAALEALVAEAGAPLDLRIPAAFALAHAADAAPGAAPATAFAAYRRAHDLALERDRLEGRRYEPALQAARRRLLAGLVTEVPPPAPPPAGQPRPIFIVGMPRSGTTLVEAMLGAHPRVATGGERPLMPQVLRLWLNLAERGETPDAATRARWAETYRAALPRRAGTDHATDKHPLNFESVGPILALFPDAAIVHLRRNPLETGLSIYRQEFNKHWAFAHRLEDIGHYYGEYARLMDHWERQFPGRVLTVQYEDFAGNFASAAPALVAALGLDWDPACLAFQQSPRPIATFSTVEARDPVSVRSGRAGWYSAELGPLAAALATAGVDLATGRLREP